MSCFHAKEFFRSAFRRCVFAWLSYFSASFSAVAETKVFECRFIDFAFFITVYDDARPSRIGTGIGIGDQARAYFDELTKAWIVVEFIADGTLPSTLTTILPNGKAWHSRHTMDVLGNVSASQMVGICAQI